MSRHPIRLATAALSGQIFAGRPAKNGLSLKEPRFDVTGDVLKCIAEHIGMGKEADVHCNGQLAYTIRISPAPKAIG